MMRTAVVLSGGEGIRLRPLTDDVPKGLVRVAGKPLLQWVLEWLSQNGISSTVIGVAYLKEKIMSHFKDGRQLGMDIVYSIHSVEGGTGEGFRLAISRYVQEKSFFALNGDQITDLPLRDLSRAHDEGDPTATIAAVHPRLPFGLIKADGSGYCRGFTEKPILREVICSSGIYAMRREILNYLPSKGDIEKTTLPKLAGEGRLKVHIHDGLFLTVNSPGELEEAERKMNKP